MPLYTIVDTKTEETHDVMLSWVKLQDYLAENPDYKLGIASPAIVDPYAVGLKKVDSKFNERLKQIKKNNPGNTIRTGNLTTI